MSYADKRKQKDYQKNWIKARRESFFNGKVCFNCGSVDSLVLHHRNPEEKESHKIWSWSEKRRLAEIAKCDVLCESCHISIHKEMGSFGRVGEDCNFSNLYTSDVVEIKKRISNGETNIEIAKDFGVYPSTISKIRVGKTWKHIEVL